MDSILPSLISIVIYFIFGFLFVFLLGIFIKHRSLISAMMFLFLLSALSFFLLNYPTLTVEEFVNVEGEINEPLANSLLSILPDYGIGPSFYSILNVLSMPVRLIYVSFGMILISLLKENVNNVSFLFDPIFVISFYAVLFVLCFLIFRKKKKKKKIKNTSRWA